ncbi:hypothetical protein EMIHUDRAFT_214477 [Emiliania huxleyi CCMP1516]|uniref:U-box domain-containing protein n=2 Tax=Emiliania huxleyi TaxID=2903 RepID=A0A0D3IK35_EMIH1|nr:hypothetical protein EMIHUDRAFT_214477 [Emiliania huxleyi CCMP1516]EOD11620.1 hypothetical protein EMIHUDRAFT_214477 [Emiliania huxleyi CCMP1516]|eukprot:XP_005764049.1 hypothetical protein EMIHUDRAFT_214477 [Emiliania huxleyi CCMP1516]
MRGLGALPLLVSSLAADVHASAGLEMPRRARVRRSATHADQVDQQGERYEDQDFEGAIRVNTADTDGRSDHSEHCTAWAAAGECDVNPDFMCAHPRQQMPTIPFAALALNLSARTHSLAFPALAPSLVEKWRRKVEWWAAVNSASTVSFISLTLCKRLSLFIDRTSQKRASLEWEGTEEAVAPVGEAELGVTIRRNSEETWMDETVRLRVLVLAVDDEDDPSRQLQLGLDFLRVCSGEVYLTTLEGYERRSVRGVSLLAHHPAGGAGVRSLGPRKFAFSVGVGTAEVALLPLPAAPLALRFKAEPPLETPTRSQATPPPARPDGGGGELPHEWAMLLTSLAPLVRQYEWLPATRLPETLLFASLVSLAVGMITWLVVCSSSKVLLVRPLQPTRQPVAAHRRRHKPRRPRAVPPEPEWWLALAEFHADLEAAAREECLSFLCSITGEMMRHPAMIVVRGVASHSFEQVAIRHWLDDGGATNPATGEELPRGGASVILNSQMQREIRSWCEARVAGWRRELEEAPCERERPAERPRVHIFVDDANIFGRTSQSLFSIAQLAACVERGRDVEERVVIGSGTSERARGLWEQQGYRVDTDPRPGRQRFVDEALHARLMQTATKSFGPPRTIALVTGDGNRNEGRTSFPACIEIALKHGWRVELHTWRATMNRIYHQFEGEYGSFFRIHFLDTLLRAASR